MKCDECPCSYESCSCKTEGEGRAIMKLNCNRFAIFPVMCDCCKRYVWLSAYRRADVWHSLPSAYWKENICRQCIPKYLPK